MSRSTLALAALVLALAACDTEPPLAPPHAVGPQFLIGQSPLAPIFLPATDPATGIVLGGAIGVTVEVNKGLTNVADADRFLLRTTVGFRDPTTGDPVSIIDPRVNDLPAFDSKDTDLRQGSTVPFEIEVALPDAAWLAVLTRPGDVTAEADVRLILETGAGPKELDGVVTAGAVDTKGNPVLAPGAAPVLEAVDAGNDAVVRRLVFEAYMPGLLLDPASGDFSFRASAAFSINGDGDPIALADPRPSPIFGGGSSADDVALVVIALPLDAATWEAIDAATSKPGDLVDVALDVELVFSASDGSKVVVDALALAGTIDPEKDGQPALDEDDGGK